jgi:hypothetical protein
MPIISSFSNQFKPIGGNLVAINVSINPPQNDFTYVLIPNNDLTYTLVPSNDLNYIEIPNNDILYGFIPDNDINYVTIPNNDVAYTLIPNTDLTYTLIPNNDIEYSVLKPPTVFYGQIILGESDIEGTCNCPEWECPRFYVTGDGPTFCDSNIFVRTDGGTFFNGWGTISYGGYYKTVNMDGSNIATYRTDCGTCPVTPTPTPTETPTPTPTETSTPTPTPTPTSPQVCDTFTFNSINANTTINSAIKTIGGGWNSSAYSVETYTNPVYVTFNMSNTNIGTMGGFSINPTFSESTYENATFGLYCENGNLKIYENGNNVHTVFNGGTITPSDLFKVEYDGTNVNYYFNNTLVYISLQSISQPLHIFFPLLTENEGVINVCVIESPTPTPTPTSTVTYYYYYLLNCNLGDNKFGRSTNPSLNGNIFNVDTNTCYTIVGNDNGPSYDYDLDIATMVTDCTDVLCLTPTPTPTNTETPTPTPTTCSHPYQYQLSDRTNITDYFNSNLSTACQALECLTNSTCIVTSSFNPYFDNETPQIGDYFYNSSSVCNRSTIPDGYYIMNLGVSGYTMVEVLDSQIVSLPSCVTPTPTETNTPTPTPTSTPTPTPTSTPTPTPNLVTTGLVIQLDANNISSYPGTGTTVFDVTGGYNHTLIGATYTVLNGIKCFDCTTGNNRVDYNATGPTLPTSGYTYITWTRLIPSNPSSFRTLIYTKGSTKITPITIPNASNTLGYWDSAFRSSGYDVSSSNGVWVQFAVVGTNSSQTFYINGSQVGSSIAYGSGGNTHWGLGNNDVVAQPWGHVANMYFYNRQLNLTEITQQYNYLAPRFVEPTPNTD